MNKFLLLLITLFFSVFAKCQTNIIDEYLLHTNENVQEKTANKIFIKTSANKTSCYVGEPIVITTKYYTRITTEAKVIHSPSYNGFSVIDLNATDTAIEKINGVAYMCYTLQKVQAYAMQEGAIEIEPIQADITAWFLKEDYYKKNNLSSENLKDFSPSNYPNDAIVSYNTLLKGIPLQLQVSALPKNGKPENFKGATGVFFIETSLEKASVPANEKNIFSVTLKGSGNIHLVSAPVLSWSKKTEFFEMTEEDRLSNYEIPVSGSKTFKYSFIATDTGNIVLPDVVFSFYNTTAHTYQSIASKPLQLRVTNPLPTKKEYIEQETTKQNWLSKIFGNRLVVVITIALGIIAGLFFWVKKDKKKELNNNALKQQLVEQKLKEQIENEALLKQNQNPLEQSLQCMLAGNVSDFYTTIHKEYKGFLLQTLLLEPSNFTKKNITAKLEEKGIAINMQHQIIEVLQLLEEQLYAPSIINNHIEKDYDAAARAIEELKENISF